MARVEVFAHDDARIVADFPGELPVADVDRVDLCRAALQQAIGEAAGARRRCRARWRRPDRSAKWSSAPSSLRPPRPTYFGGAATESSASGATRIEDLLQNAVAERDFAGHDGALRLFAAGEGPCSTRTTSRRAFLLIQRNGGRRGWRAADVDDRARGSRRPRFFSCSSVMQNGGIRITCCGSAASGDRNPRAQADRLSKRVAPTSPPLAAYRQQFDRRR